MKKLPERCFNLVVDSGKSTGLLEPSALGGNAPEDKINDK